MGVGEEVEVGLNGSVDVPVESRSPGKDELKRLRDFVDDGAELYTSPGKRQVKDLPSDKDDCSEVSNPTVYPSGSEIQDPFSPTSKLPDDGSVVRCSEVTSKSSVLSPKETMSNEGSIGSGNGVEFDSRTDGNESSAKSCVVLEIPKHISTTGIRKITFKLSKKKEYRDDENSSFVHHPYFNRSERDGQDGHIKVEQDGGIPERMCSPHSPCTPNLELKMSKKVVPSCYPTNVKKLLQTGILDGARIKYISSSKDQRHLDGVIKAGGYLCGCSFCNYSKVLSAFEFEQHAGFKSKHPNNRIFLENGKPVYSIIQELKNAPKGILDVVLKDVAGSAINEDSFKAWKESLVHGSGEVEVKNPYTTFYHQSRGIELSNRTIEYYAKDNTKRPTTLMDEYKLVMKMPGMYSGYSLQPKKTAESSKRSRDNDLHKLLFMPNGLPEGAELAYIIKGQRILGGYKQGNGIVCNCCQKEISPSQFEAHAGMAVRRQPYRHIYASNGLNLHDIALSLANGHNLAGSSDNMCSSCGEEGNLILCVQCPRAFHAACLGLESVPEGDWCCSNCMDKSLPGKKAISGDINGGRQMFIRLTRVVKEPEYDIGGCCICRDHDFSTGTFDERTVIICDQCEKEFHVGCLRKIGRCDLRELPSEKWFCCVDCHRIHEALERSVSGGFETVPCSSLDIISRKYMEKGLLFGGSGNDVQWRILSGKSRFPEHLPLLSRATAIFRECFDPIVAASGRDLIPVMVYGRNISGQEFGGMYCVVLTVKSVVVSAGLLRIFGKEVAELPMVATCGEFQGKGYFQTLFTRIEGLLHSLNVEKLVLPAAEEAESIWTKKFGFRRMSEENLMKHMKDHQLTIFKGTSMLEKEVSIIER